MEGQLEQALSSIDNLRSLKQDNQLKACVHFKRLCGSPSKEMQYFYLVYELA